jgi:hypothetical protein
VVGRRVDHRLDVETVATDKIAYDDSALTAAIVFESYNHHPMALQTATPAVVAVLGADAARGDEFGVACCANIVVARLCVGNGAGAGITMVAGRRRLDRIATDITVCGEGKGFEITHINNTWTFEDCGRGWNLLVASWG